MESSERNGAASAEARLARILVKNSYLHREEGMPPFLLASGKESDFYFDCQRTTSKAEALPLIGEVFHAKLHRDVKSVGGLTRGADPIALAIAYRSETVGRGINAFSVRKDKKNHGTQRWIEGWADRDDPVALVDDVITTGNSVIKALDRCREAGVRILQVIVLVDREEGGIENIRQALGDGTCVESIFSKQQLDAILSADGQQPDTKRNQATAPAVRSQPHR
jgi:orotate phosphoribosyltransferase